MEQETADILPEMALKFDSVCRLCMKQEDEEQMCDIFTQEKSLSVKLSHILPQVDINAGDGLPSQVCQSCAHEVDCCHQFLMQCEFSDATLRKHLIAAQSVGVAEDPVAAEDNIPAVQDTEEVKTDSVTTTQGKYSVTTTQGKCSKISNMKHIMCKSSKLENGVTSQQMNGRAATPLVSCNKNSEPNKEVVTSPTAVSQQSTEASCSIHKLTESNNKIATALSTLTQDKNTSLIKLAEPNNTPLLLVQKPVKLAEPNNSAITPLLLVQQNKNTSLVQKPVKLAEPNNSAATPLLLVQKPIKLAEPNNSAATPLLLVQQNKNTSLVQKPVKLAEPNSSATTPLLLVQQNKNTSLVQKPVKLAEPNNSAATPLLLVQKPIKLAEPNNSAATPLLLVQKPVKLAEPNNSATTPLLLVQEPVKLAEPNSSATTPLLLVQKPVKLAEPNNSATTPLLLVQKPVKLAEPNRSATTPLLLVQQNKDSAVLQTLVKFKESKNGTDTSSVATPLLISQQDNHSLTSNISLKLVNFKKPTNGAQMDSATKPLVILQQDKANSSIQNVKPCTYFIPIKQLQENKVCDSLNLQKPVAVIINMGSDTPTTGRGSVRPMTGCGSGGPKTVDGPDSPKCSSESDRPFWSGCRHSCHACSKQFPNKVQYLDHLQSHKILKCKECGKFYQTAYKLKLHTLQHTGQKAVAAVCDKCGLTFTTFSSYRKHRLIHLGIKPFQCHECKNFYASRQSLKSHVRIHTGEKPYVCEKCGYACRDLGMLIVHRKFVHEGLRKRYKCTLCPKVYRSNASLKVHLTVHSGTKAFKCAECGKTFAHKGMFIRHQMGHTNEQSYNCSICHKSFKSETGRDRHLRLHTGESPYKCEQCNRGFVCWRDCRNHKRKVHGQQLEMWDVEILQDDRGNQFLETSVPNFSDKEFLEHFRIRREIVQDLSKQFQESDQYKRHTGQYGKISAFNQVLIFLWYLGQQTSPFRDIVDKFGITISSLHRIIQRVVMFLSSLSPQIITWPHQDEISHITECFRNSGFPGVAGIIGITHIRIAKPENDPDSYLNSKGFYSIQMQAVIDHNMKFRDVFLGYPGSAPDSKVFQESPLSSSLEEKCGEYYLLGDSRYPLKRNLLTPFTDNGDLTSPQVHFNEELLRIVCIVEQAFVLMKEKFKQLGHVKLRSIFLIVDLVRAACVLHNLAVVDSAGVK